MKDFVRLLREHFEEIKKRSPAFSQRAFAKKIGVSSGTLSEILAGKRKITHKQAEKIAQKLDFSPYDRKILGLSMGEDGLHLLKNISADEETIKAISSWWHFAILNIISLPGCQSNAGLMAKRLGISKQNAEEALTRLQKLGLIKRSSGKWKRTGHRIVINQEQAVAAIQESFLDDVALIKKSFAQVPAEYRCNASAVFSVDKKKLIRLRTLVHQFLQSEFLPEAESKAPDEVYKILVHFFPLTQLK